jgi:Domain of unknown function (DUF4333)
MVLACLLAACGGAGRQQPAAAPGDRLVGTTEVEKLLVSTQKRKSPLLRVGAARCPERVRLANGETFTCTVEIEGAIAPYEVTLRQVDAARGTGRFALRPAKPIIDVTRVVGLIRGRLRPAARSATVGCGTAKVRVVEVGATIRCTVSLGGAARKVDAVVKDLDGTVVVKA